MLLNSTKCKCGKELSNTRFDKYTPNLDRSFYGGRVDITGTVECECGRTLKGYFTRLANQNLMLIDLEVCKDIPNDKKIDLKPTSLVYDEPSVTYIPKQYEEMTYRDLQAICKEKGIKSNGSREKLIEQLRES